MWRLAETPATQSHAAGSMRTQSRIRYPALIDTGSRVSCIDSTLAEELDLPAVADGAACRLLGFWATMALLMSIWQTISIPELRVVGGRVISPALTLLRAGQPYRALIGRDIY